MLAHQTDFITSLRGGPEMRKRVFDVLEQRHASDLAAARYYETLLAIVQEADVPEAIEEYRHRFHPLLDRGRSDSGPSKEIHNRTKPEDSRSGAWRWMVAVGAVVIVGTAIGFNTLRTTTAKVPVVTAATAAPAAPEPEAVAAEEPERVTPAAEQNAQ
jgi:anti-sigma-K factor RskA